MERAMPHPRSAERSAEFALLLACCRWPLSPAEYGAITNRAAHVDWTRFLRLAARHRVEGIVAKALADAGVELSPAVKAEMSTAATAIARQNLTLAAESIRLKRLLEQAGLAPLFVKGVTLGKLAYGDIARKAGWDIDLLVAPEDVLVAAAVLAQRGYTLTMPRTDRQAIDLPLWHRHAKESVWQSADATIWVELHTALTDNPLLLPGVGTTSPRRAVEVSPGMALPTLAHDELFAYLCVHGASSAWFRLKWIADFAALIGGEAPEEVDRLYRRSVELGAGRAAAQALLLADALFGSMIPSGLKHDLRSDRMSRWLVAIALRKLTGRAGEVELDDVMLGTASIHAAQLGLLPGWRFKRSVLARLLVSPIDRLATPLPAMLAWLYPVMQVTRRIRGQSAG